MATPRDVIAMIESGASREEVESVIEDFLAIKFPDPAFRPTVVQYIKSILPELWRWATPDSSEVLKSAVLSKSSDPVVAAKYKARFDGYVFVYEQIEGKFGRFDD